MTGSELGDVCLVVATFRHDDAVRELLERVCAGGPHPFHEIIIVDSQGTGDIAELIEHRRYERVRYHSAEENLGSAGNFARRLKLAGEGGASYAYAVNHDGHVDLGCIARLAQVARADLTLGAVYPLRRLPGRGGAYDLSGTRRAPLVSVRSLERPAGPLLPAYWSTSNGALYNLAPIREGLLPWADLWMGWEDLGFGWLLHEKGWRQVLVTDAESVDPYEFRRARGGVWITDKPSWYAYYYARNLLLLNRRARPGAQVTAATTARLLAEFPVTLLLRRDKLHRLRLLCAGVADGLRGRAGKWTLP